MDASRKQIGYMISLGRKCGIELDKDDFYDDDQPIIDSRKAHSMIQEFKAALKMIDDELDVMRKGLITMARTIGWEMPDPNNPQKAKANMPRIENWCVKYGKYHKSLNKHNKAEMGALIKQFEAGPYADKVNKQKNNG